MCVYVCMYYVCMYVKLGGAREIAESVKGLSYKNEGLTLLPRRGGMDVILLLGMQTQAAPWALLATQLS